ncbi:MAG: hypothetical protein NZ521_01515 [Flammeovirgaceae bacterium]|nr:hypothetical protein [Flammeovirgaceae bacterium]MDW8286786.1 hypothetical protein [Flammeovirgaceae bacterium]
MKEFMKAKGLNKHRLEMSLGLSNGLLGKVIKHQTSFRVEVLVKMLELYPELSAEWLLRGKGDMFLTNTTNHSPTTHSQNYYLQKEQQEQSISEQQETGL